jgi:hypothetical protein
VDAGESIDIYESRREFTERRGSGGRLICSDCRSRDGDAGSAKSGDVLDCFVPSSSAPASSLSCRSAICEARFKERNKGVEHLEVSLIVDYILAAFLFRCPPRAMMRATSALRGAGTAPLLVDKIIHFD